MKTSSRWDRKLGSKHSHCGFGIGRGYLRCCESASVRADLFINDPIFMLPELGRKPEVRIGRRMCLWMLPKALVVHATRSQRCCHLMWRCGLRSLHIHSHMHKHTHTYTYRNRKDARVASVSVFIHHGPLSHPLSLPSTACCAYVAAWFLNGVEIGATCRADCVCVCVCLGACLAVRRVCFSLSICEVQRFFEGTISTTATKTKQLLLLLMLLVQQLLQLLTRFDCVEVGHWLNSFIGSQKLSFLIEIEWKQLQI